MELKNYQKQTLAKLAAYLTEAKVIGSEAAFQNQQDAPGYPTKYAPIPNLEGVPYVCLRLPTGGGKTLLGSYIIKLAAANYLEQEYPFVLWLVPTDTIRQQTLKTLNDVRHPNREALAATFGNNVRVYDVTEFTRLRPQDVTGAVNIFVATFAALRVEDKKNRKVYDYHETLVPCFRDIPKQPYFDETEYGYQTFRNLLAYIRPLVIIDEAHNHKSDLSVEVLNRLRSSVIVELTATPAKNSNVLYTVSASELKAEEMIKLPITLTEHQTWEDAAESAVQQRNRLEKLAAGEPDYVRPIALFQAENKDKDVTAEKVREYLINEAHIPEEQVAVATGEKHELDGVDLLSRDCQIRYVITVQALKEGWDCPFAYVFCSLAKVHSPKDAEQLLGRVLRMPYAKRREVPELNEAYANVAVSEWMEAAGKIRDNLLGMGFEDAEADTALRYKQPKLPGLDTEKTTVRFQVSEAPNENALREILAETVEPTETGLFAQEPKVEKLSDGKYSVTIENVSSETLEALAKAPSKIFQKKANQETLRRAARQVAAFSRPKSPSERGVKFSVPQLCLDFGDGVGVFAADSGDFLPEDWVIAEEEPVLSSFSFDLQKYVYEFDVMGHRVTEKLLSTQEDALFSPGDTNWTEIDLVGWLTRRTLPMDLTFADLSEYVRRVVTWLQTTKGAPLSDLVRLRFKLEKLLTERIDVCREAATERGMQGALFGEDAAVCVTSDVAMAFGETYPAKALYKGAKRFQKHFYSLIGDMNSEEEICAQYIDSNPNVETWVRNIEKEPQHSFWLPTHKQRFYPDFIAKLKSGVVCLIEYKGEPYATNDDTKEKDMIGMLWAEKGGKMCRFLMATTKDEQGRDLAAQVREILA
ncbi:MAG: DEAD/DEAH box helicase family protein [Schwartzia sp.]|nr:DEAD/DEAH box helicase family protein [Schwartzia sp. (in: firmicutes)]